MLPKIDLPLFEIKLPVSGKKLSFRPILVKEQKLLLMASESEDKPFLYQTIKQILNNCCVSKDIKIEELPIVDFEFLFLNIRAKSVGEIVEANYRCENIVDGEICNNLMEVSYNILQTEVNFPNKNRDIKLTKNIGVKMKYPDYNSLEKVVSGIEDENNFIDILMNSIEFIYDKDSIYDPKESTKEELSEFIDSLNISQINKIKEFFTTLPFIEKNLNITCNKCGFNHNIHIKGLANFFD